MKLTTLIGVGLAIITSGASAQDRPAKRAQQGRGQLFISPMGEPFRSTQKPGAAQALWFAEADADHDGRLTASEFQRDALRFFAMLDRRQDGEIDPEDIGWYENVLVPEIRVRQGRGSSPRASGAQKSGDRGERGRLFAARPPFAAIAGLLRGQIRAVRSSRTRDRRRRELQSRRRQGRIRQGRRGAVRCARSQP